MILIPESGRAVVKSQSHLGNAGLSGTKTRGANLVSNAAHVSIHGKRLYPAS